MAKHRTPYLPEFRQQIIDLARAKPHLTGAATMLRARSLRVIAQLVDTEMRVDYCELTGRLRILQEGVLMHEWFPPNSWITIASVAGTRNWGTRPNSNELRALLEHQISLLRVG